MSQKRNLARRVLEDAARRSSVAGGHSSHRSRKASDSRIRIRLRPRPPTPAPPLVCGWDILLVLTESVRSYNCTKSFSAPKYFDSLLTINVFVGVSSFPAVYFLLPDRSEETYSRALEAVFGDESMRNVDPESFVCGTKKSCDVSAKVRSRFRKGTAERFQ